MSPPPIWPQPPSTPSKPSPPPKSPLPAVPTYPVGNSPRPSYTEQLRQMSAAQIAPYVEQLNTAPPPLAADKPLREAMVQLLANTLANGRDRISGQEIFWRLRIPPQLENTKGRDIARVLRSLGWVRCHYGTDKPEGHGRVWGWKWREWSISAALVAQNAADEGPPPAVFRPHRAPIITIYGDDVPVHAATPEGIWAIIRYPIGPRLKIGR